MCVAAIAWNCSERYRLVAVGNRDELHARAAAPLARWPDRPALLAGRDLVGGGTWLGVHEAGRFALVTNYSVPGGSVPGRPSRGRLVTDLLDGRVPTGTDAMNPFNLFLVAQGTARFVTNHPAPRDEPLAPGIHGLSNGGFEDRWPKTARLETALAGWIADQDATGGSGDPKPLLAAMRDATPLAAADAERGPEGERSAVFIANPLYGTRCSTVVAVGRNGAGWILERRFDAAGRTTGETRLGFAWTDQPA